MSVKNRQYRAAFLAFNYLSGLFPRTTGDQSQAIGLVATQTDRQTDRQTDTHHRCM